MKNDFPLQPLKNNKYRIFKSRYDSIDSYLSSCGEKYNDIDLTIDKEVYEQLLSAGTVIWEIGETDLKTSMLSSVGMSEMNGKLSQ